ncbi:MAG: hypothetical protein AAF799_21860 [Myxococcota bacterium]
MVRASIVAGRNGLANRNVFSLGLSPDAEAQQLLALPELREEAALRIADRLARRRDEGVLLSLHVSARGRPHWHGLALTRLSKCELVELCVEAGLSRQAVYVRPVESQSNPGGSRFLDHLRQTLQYHLALPKPQPPGFDPRPIATGRLRGILKRAIRLAGRSPRLSGSTASEASIRSPEGIRRCTWCGASILLLREDAKRCSSCRRRAHRAKRTWALGFAVTVVLKFPGLQERQICETVNDMLPESEEDIPPQTFGRWLGVLLAEGSIVVDRATGSLTLGVGHRTPRDWSWQGHA